MPTIPLEAAEADRRTELGEQGERHAGTNVRTGGGGGSTLVLRLALSALAAAILAAIIVANFPQPAQAQTGDETTGYIIARRLVDDRVEFGWQLISGERFYPEQRYFPAGGQATRWLRSSPVVVAGVEIGRINARRLGDQRIEFGFTPTIGLYIQPSARYLPVDTVPNQWLRSTAITVRIPGPGPDDSGLTPSRAEKKNLLAEHLFGLQQGTADRLTNHDYNDFGARPGTVCNGYQGGHSGWDVQTKSVSPGNGGNRLVNVPFYSLTAGEVNEVGVDGNGNTIIAVYDGQRTTLYYHARLIEVYEGARVQVGTRLGIQGMAGTATGVHVHVEVRDRERTRAACGAPGSIDPIGDNYLWRSVTTARPVTTSVVRAIANLADGERIRASGTIDQYVVKRADERRFKRLILNLNVLRAYGWTTPETVVGADVLNAVATSTLVWIADARGVVPPGANVYHLRPNGDRGTRHHVTAEVFAAAGLDWESVFTISSAEGAIWREGAPLNHSDIRELRRAQGYHD